MIVSDFLALKRFLASNGVRVNGFLALEKIVNEIRASSYTEASYWLFGNYTFVIDKPTKENRCYSFKTVEQYKNEVEKERHAKLKASYKKKDWKTYTTSVIYDGPEDYEVMATTIKPEDLIGVHEALEKVEEERKRVIKSYEDYIKTTKYK